MDGQGAMTITAADESAACRVRTGREAAMSAVLPPSALSSGWRLPALSVALAGAPLALGSRRAMRAMTLLNLGVLLALLRQAMRIEAWERG